MTPANQECPISAEELKEKWEKLYEGFNDDPKIKEFKEKHQFLLRLLRAISWLGRAQQMERDVKETSKDLHARFIFLWIGFNALYARDPYKNPFEEDYIKIYFLNLLNCGRQQVTGRIYKIIDSNISKEKIRSLSRNKFISMDFWEKVGVFKKRKEKDQSLPEPLSKEKTFNILLCVFQRLSVLRNQLVHGSTTWDGDLGKGQLIDGTEIMRWLLPAFIEIMLQTPEEKWEKWGKVYFPRVENKPILKKGNKAPKNET